MTDLIARITTIELPEGPLTAERVEHFVTGLPGDDQWRQGAPGQVYGFTLWDRNSLMFVALWDGTEGLDATDARYEDYMTAGVARAGGRVIGIRRWSVRGRWLDPFLMSYMRYAPGARRDPFPFDAAFAWLESLIKQGGTGRP